MTYETYWEQKSITNLSLIYHTYKPYFASDIAETLTLRILFQNDNEAVRKYKKGYF